MRRSSFISLGVAIVLAMLAVFGARAWLDQQRADILASNQPLKSKVDMVVVAGSTLRFGDRLTSGKLKLISWPVGKKPVGTFGTIKEVTGAGDDDARFVMSAIEVNEPILTTKITVPGQRAKLSAALTQGMKAVSIRVNDVLGVAGFVLPGDRVDIMLTRAARRQNSRAYVDVLLQGVKVLAIDQSADDRKDTATVVRTVTFEVSTAEAQKLTLAANIGTLSLALRNISSAGIESTDRITLQDLGGGEVSQTLAKEVEKEQTERQEDLANIEKLVKDVGIDLNSRIKKMENNIKLQKEVAPKPVLARPNFSIIGVTRSGKRSEYRFKADE